MPPASADPSLDQRVRDDFEKQGAMRLLGARLTRVEDGLVEIELPFRPEVSQQHGFFHAGVLGTIADSAGGYAALTRMPAGSEVLSVEYKLNLLTPARGDLAVTQGRVVRAGRTLSVCELKVDVEREGARKTCAWGLQTLIRREADALR